MADEIKVPIVADAKALKDSVKRAVDEADLQQWLKHSGLFMRKSATYALPQDVLETERRASEYHRQQVALNTELRSRGLYIRKTATYESEQEVRSAAEREARAAVRGIESSSRRRRRKSSVGEMAEVVEPGGGRGSSPPPPAPPTGGSLPPEPPGKGPRLPPNFPSWYTQSVAMQAGAQLTTPEMYRGALLQQEILRATYGGKVPLSRANLWEAQRQAGLIDPFGRKEYRQIAEHLSQTLPIMGEPRHIPALTRLGRLLKGRAIYTGSRIAAAAVIYRTAEAFREVIRESNHLGAALAQTTLSARATGAAMTEWGRDRLQRVAGMAGMSLDVLAQASGEALRGGAGGNQNLAVTMAAAQLGQVHNVDANKLARPIARLMQAYKLPELRTGEVTELLNAASRRGPMAVEDLAQAAAHVAPVAAAKGVKMHDVVAALVQMQRAGLEPNEAATAIVEGMQQIINPNERLQAFASRAGIPLGETGLRESGLTGTFARLSRKLSTEALSQAFSGHLGIRALPMFANASDVAAEDELKELSRSWGSLARDQVEIERTSQDSWRRLQAGAGSTAAGVLSPGTSPGLLESFGHIFGHFGRSSAGDYSWYAQRSWMENYAPAGLANHVSRDQSVPPEGFMRSPRVMAYWARWRERESQSDEFGRTLEQQRSMTARLVDARRTATSAFLPQLIQVQQEQTEHLNVLQSMTADETELASLTQTVATTERQYIAAGDQVGRAADIAENRRRTIERFKDALPQWVNARTGAEQTRRRLIADALIQRLQVDPTLDPTKLLEESRAAETTRHQAVLASIWSAGQPMYRMADWSESMGGRSNVPIPAMTEQSVLTLFQSMERFLGNISSNTAPSCR